MVQFNQAFNHVTSNPALSADIYAGKGSATEHLKQAFGLSNNGAANLARDIRSHLHTPQGQHQADMNLRAAHSQGGMPNLMGNMFGHIGGQMHSLFGGDPAEQQMNENLHAGDKMMDYMDQQGSNARIAMLKNQANMMMKKILSNIDSYWQ